MRTPAIDILAAIPMYVINAIVTAAAITIYAAFVTDIIFGTDTT